MNREMINKNEELERLIISFRSKLQNKDAVEETKASYQEMLEALEKAVVLMPIEIQEITEEQMKLLKQGEGLPIELMKKTEPLWLKKTDGTVLLPIFTSKEQIPEDKGTPLLCEIPYEVCVDLFMRQKEQVEYIVMNPFTECINLSKEVIEIAYKRLHGAEKNIVEAVEKAKATPGFSQKQVAYSVLPGYLYKDLQTGMEHLKKERENLILDMLRSVHQGMSQFPYTAEDISIMFMNVSEALLIVRIDMPEKYREAASAIRIYLAVQDSVNLQYFMILHGGDKEKGPLVSIDNSGEMHILCDAPDEGAEISTIMERIEGGK